MSGQIRPGEIRIALPDSGNAGLFVIGRIRTPWSARAQCPKNGAMTDSLCRVEVEPRYAGGLAGLEGTSHLILLYWMHEADRDLIVQRPRHHGEPRGTFSIRSPVRPNPIALSVVRLLRLDGLTLEVQGLDCLDGTPLLDIKPYLPSVDSRPDAVVKGARAAGEGSSEKARADIDGECQDRRVEQE